MLNIDKIIDALKKDQIRITDHADEEAHADKLSFEEIFMSVINGKILENYPDDKPFPSCLIFGRNMKDEPIHSVWAYNPKNQWVVLITVYRPDPTRWINWEERR